MAGLWPAGWAPGAAPSGAPPEAAPLILTVALPDALQREAGLVRSAHQPAAAMRAPAHLGLFRHLPGLEQPALGRTLRAVADRPAPAFTVGAPASWNGRWVAPIVAPGLDDLRAELVERWHGLLTPADRAPVRLHISLGKGRDAPPALPAGPWRARGLLLWRHAASAAERGRPDLAAERGRPDLAAERGGPDLAAEHGGPFWTPLVAVGFHG